MQDIGTLDLSSVYLYSDGTPSFKIGPTTYTAISAVELKTKDPEKDTTPFEPGVFKLTNYSVSRTYYRAGNGKLVLYAPYPYAGNLLATEDTYSGCLGAWCYPFDNFVSFMGEPFILENHRRAALQKAYAKLGKAQLELAVEIGEVNETAEFLRNPFKKLRDFSLKPVKEDRDGTRWSKLDLAIQHAASLFSKGKGGRSAKAGESSDALLSQSAGAWMEYRYALMPLCRTISDILEELARKRLALDLTKIYSVASNKSYEVDIELPQLDNLTVIPNLVQTSFGSLSKKYSIKAKVYYRKTSERSALDTYGLTPRFAPETAWELLSKSFVLDWVISVGAWLGSYRVNPSIEILGDTVSTKTVMRGEIHHTVKPATAGQNLRGSISDTYVHVDSYDRKINLGRPYLPTYTGLDTWDVPKTIDSLAMLLQPVIDRCKKLRRKL